MRAATIRVSPASQRASRFDAGQRPASPSPEATAGAGAQMQPISFIGPPVVAVPVPLHALPIGVQIIAAHWREACCPSRCQDPGVWAA
jgi:Asp-tRNA(Asn)/Glu-tRNA(Gln) amidotransferase A subunit family amidase